ncbi:MAG: CoA-binding protein [Candidatus Thorarchaeota archaeon]
MDAKTFQQFEDFIHSKSVALIGTSKSANFYWLQSFLNFGFPGKIYPVNPKVDEAFGLKFYKTLSDVPDPVDYAVLRVPADRVSQVLDECIAKGVKCITIFTSGFSELGTEEGRQREREIIDKIRASPMRAFGPNCIGLTCPESHFAFRPDLKPNPGPIGFISQSGGKAIDFYLALAETKVGCSKAFSYGNEGDISSWELVEYLHQDPDTQVIGMYIEGVRNGPKLRQAITACASDKPIIVWKTGITEAGKKAVSSHSAALAGSADIWNALLRQSGAVAINSFEQLINTTVTFIRCPPPPGKRVALIAISGGAGVAGTDALAHLGFEIPRLSSNTIRALSKIVNAVGTNIKNPIDMASSYFYPDITVETIRHVAEDKKIDALIIEAAPHYVNFMAEHMNLKELAATYWDMVIEAGTYCVKTLHKPFMVAVPAIGYPLENLATRNQFRAGNLPVFSSINEAADILRIIYDYYQQHPKLSTPPALNIQ